MACFHPISACRLADGRIVLGSRADAIGFLSLPCGKCIGCFKVRARAWAIRIMHEAKLHERNCFITLTYADDKLPYRGSLDHRDFQLFMKRLRKKFNCFDVKLWSDVPRYFMCGEYGPKLLRPHFHACLFGVDFPDKVLIKNGKNPLFTSKILSDVWGLGHVSVGSLDFASARYVAAYCTKKISGDAAITHYRRVDLDTGEVYSLAPEYGQMSRRPGIGSFWYDKFGTDVFPHDRVVINGSQAPPPRYYARKFRRTNPDVYELILADRLARCRNHSFYVDNTRARLRAREFFEVEVAKSFKRNL